MATLRQMHVDALDFEQKHAEQLELTNSREELEMSLNRIQHGIETITAIDRGEHPGELSDEACDEAEAITEPKIPKDFPF